MLKGQFTQSTTRFFFSFVVLFQIVPDSKEPQDTKSGTKRGSKGALCEFLFSQHLNNHEYEANYSNNRWKNKFSEMQFSHMDTISALVGRGIIPAFQMRE